MKHKSELYKKEQLEIEQKILNLTILFNTI
jgi:hypothetical protein